MSSFQDIALPLIERGFRVFPLIPGQKMPQKLGSGDHFDAATLEPSQIKSWDAQSPTANVGVAPDEIFCFLETDDESSLKAQCADIPSEVWDATRVSARENRCYYIFRQTSRTRKVGNMTAAQTDGKPNLFEFKQFRVYVVGPGSIHPKTGKPYGVEWRNIPAMPDVLLNRLCELYGQPKASESRAMSDETQKQTALLDSFLETYGVATTGDWFNKGKQWYRPIECPWRDTHENENAGTSTCVVYTEGGGYGFDCKHRCSSKDWKEFRAELESRFPGKAKFAFVEPHQPTGIISEQPVVQVSNWRDMFHTREETEHAPQIKFSIEGFLQDDGITGLSAPPGHRKTLIMLNTALSLLNGKPLFGKFKVNTTAERVVYLVPEVALTPFAHRLTQFGLVDYIGTKFFFRTLSAQGKLALGDGPLLEAIQGAHVFLDTVPRFIEGNENDAEDIRRLGEQLFQLLQAGARSVVGAFHMPKGAKKNDYFDLESCVRGSSDLGALLTAAWGTRLQDEKEPYKSPSYVECVKQRDFEACAPFELLSSDAGIMTARVGVNAVTLKPGLGNYHASNKDGLEQMALDYIRKHPEQSLRQMEEGLSALGISRRKDWVSKKRKALLSPNADGKGVALSARQ